MHSANKLGAKSFVRDLFMCFALLAEIRTRRGFAPSHCDFHGISTWKLSFTRISFFFQFARYVVQSIQQDTDDQKSQPREHIAKKIRYYLSLTSRCAKSLPISRSQVLDMH